MTKAELQNLCDQLKMIQRSRSDGISQKNKIMNATTAVVARTFGYNTKLTKALREKKWKEGRDRVEEILKEVKRKTKEKMKGIQSNIPDPYPDWKDKPYTVASCAGIAEMEMFVNKMTKELVALAEQLPIADWIKEPQQRGVDYVTLGALVGEAGDFSNYSTQYKLHKRFGLAPFKREDGLVQMGSTWRSKKHGKLSDVEWQKFGYSPRRRSISYVIGENIVKQNKSIYRKKFDFKKAEKAKRCDNPKCHAKQKKDGTTCRRCHRHGMIVATKMLIENMWRKWRDVVAEMDQSPRKIKVSAKPSTNGFHKTHPSKNGVHKKPRKVLTKV